MMQRIQTLCGITELYCHDTHYPPVGGKIVPLGESFIVFGLIAKKQIGIFQR